MKTLSERERILRNLQPTREAYLAMIVWGKEYSQQSGGSMDFWDRLDNSRKKLVRQWIRRLDKIAEKDRIAGAWSNDCGDDE